LRTAPIVLLFLNPGFVDFDLEHAQSIGGQDFYFRQRSGNSELPSKDEHPFAHKWWASRIKHLGVDETKASKNVAIVNISPYKSKGFSDYHMLAALPSSRACLNWAQSELFPSAKSKQRVVICLRSAAYWGLGCASETGFLFIPEVNRGGFMSRNMRPAIQKAISSVAPHLMPLS